MKLLVALCVMVCVATVMARSPPIKMPIAMSMVGQTTLFRLQQRACLPECKLGNITQVSRQYIGPHGKSCVKCLFCSCEFVANKNGGKCPRSPKAFDDFVDVAKREAAIRMIHARMNHMFNSKAHSFISMVKRMTEAAIKRIRAAANKSGAIDSGSGGSGDA